MKFELVQRYAAPLADVADAFTDPGLYAKMADLPKVGRPEVLEQVRHVARDLGSVGQVVVVEDQVEPLRQAAELVEHGGQHGRDRGVGALEEW